jgi:hypothetical protein
MKPIFATLVAALLLTASAAHAKPPKTAKDAFACTIVELKQWEAPDEDSVAIVIAVRLSCHNNGPKSVRLKAADVYLLNTDDQKYRPDRDSDNLDTIFEDEDPGPAFVDHFVDIAKGETKDLGFTFTGGNGLTDPHLTLDIDGVKYEHHRAVTPDFGE